MHVCTYATDCMPFTRYPAPAIRALSARVTHDTQNTHHSFCALLSEERMYCFRYDQSNAPPRREGADCPLPSCSSGVVDAARSKGKRAVPISAADMSAFLRHTRSCCDLCVHTYFLAIFAHLPILGQRCCTTAHCSFQKESIPRGRWSPVD